MGGLLGLLLIPAGVVVGILGGVLVFIFGIFVLAFMSSPGGQVGWNRLPSGKSLSSFAQVIPPTVYLFPVKKFKPREH